jgi:hypothetical protein
MRTNQPDYAKAAEPAALFPDPRLAVVGGSIGTGSTDRTEEAPKTCLGAFRLVLEHARQRKRAFLLEGLSFLNPPHPVRYRF